MKLLINTSNNLTGGSLQVAISFITECKKFNNNIYVIALGDNVSKQINKNEFPDNFQFYSITSSPFYKLSSKLKKIELETKPDIVFSVFGPSYWRPKVKHIMGFANPYYGRKSTYIKRLSLKEKILLKGKQLLHQMYVNHDADVIISETNEASDAFRKVFKKVEQFEVVSNNCSNFYWNYKKNNSITTRNDNEYKLLTLSNYRPNKNLECIPKVIYELKRQNINNVKFVLTIDKKIFEEKFSQYEGIINVGPQKAEDCPKLYEQCYAMFLPTYLECFSASYPEAMRMEKPILTSDLGFARDICNDAALFFNPDSPIDIASKIIQLINSPELYDELIKKGLKRLLDFPTPEIKTKQILNIIEHNL